MTGRRWLWRAVAAITAVLVLVPTGAATWAKLDRQAQVIDSVFRRPVTHLDLAVGDGSVLVSPGPAGRVSLRGTLTWSLYRPRVRTSWAGGTLTVALACGPQSPDLVAGVLGSGCWGVKLDLRVPPGVSVAGRATSGEMDVRDLGGRLRLSATTGSVVMTGDSGAIQASATAGAIVGRGLTSATVSTALTSGSAVLQFTGDPQVISARVDAGSASITVPPGSRYRITGGAGVGSLSIAPGLADRAASRTIALTVGSGDASVGYPGSG